MLIVNPQSFAVVLYKPDGGAVWLNPRGRTESQPGWILPVGVLANGVLITPSNVAQFNGQVVNQTPPPPPEASVYTIQNSDTVSIRRGVSSRDITVDQFKTQVIAPLVGSGGGGSGVVTWSSITNKPATFAPSTHTHDAADISSGVLDIARLPFVPSGKPIVSSGDLTSLTSPQQAAIAEGTIVVTTDGIRQAYIGTGSKTNAANYIVLADMTPPWASIPDKPTDIVNLSATLSSINASLSSKADSSTVALKLDTSAFTNHTHTISSITNLSSELNNKSDLVHTHAIADVTNLQTALDGKAPATHTHDAADIISGVLDPARIPILLSQVPVVSSGAISNLTSPQQSQIATGTIVLTTDGFRWVYSGSGSKTLEASYILLSDTTPDWSVIANKPSSFTPAVHGHIIADVTGLQSALDGKSNVTATVLVQTSSYTMVLADAGKFIYVNAASAATLTLPANAGVGTDVTIVQGGAGQVTIAAASGATLREKDGYTKSAKQYAAIYAICVENSGGSAAAWLLSGATTA